MATKKAASTTKKAPVAKKAPAKKSRSSVKSAPARASKKSVLGYVQQSVRSLSLWRSLGAEFIGTFLLAAAVITGSGQPIIVMFAVVGIVLLVGALSGAHINPAITIGALITRRIDWFRALGYLVAQFLGAALAFVALSTFVGGSEVSAEAALYGQSAATLFSAVDLTTLAGKEWYVFFAELLGTAILGYAVANALRAGERVTSALSVGLGIFIALMVAVSAASYVGASGIINPAVAVSLQALSWSVWPLAVYVLAPVIGATLGFVIFDLLNGRRAK